MKNYCYYCDKEVEYEVKEKDVIVPIKGVDVAYKAKIAFCEVCGNEIDVPELEEQNIKTANTEYRKKAGLITREEIENILNTYNIGKKPLARLLGWGEVTIERYLNGITPLKIYSDELKKLQNPAYMKKVYESNKEVLTDSARRKIEAALERCLNFKEKRTVDVFNVADFFLSKVDVEAGSSITPLKLQKLIYYAQGWHMAFFDKPLFDSDLQAWIHGPVSPEIYYRYQNYKYNEIEKVDFDYSSVFDAEQIQLLNKIYDVYGVFDAILLKEMTHKDRPWKKARKGHAPDQQSNEIISKNSIRDYFKEIKELFDINEIADIKKSIRLYEDILYDK